ncbi:plasmalemma vesicle-associated protein [Zootoca vivipara]|uniref:plasmalemma vesicle-associated protein n=1 Tax=Zootoca vivipara TaxID=8524 RepID=UPI0015927CCC|nr:plasmalemma vesicle-associated protein [Zootoca vivipara]
MEKNPYTIAKLGLELKENPNKRDCGFYMKYFFLFLSLIQFLIILGLVLFMVYGNGNSEENAKKHEKAIQERLLECNKKSDALSSEIGNFKSRLNASQVEARLSKTQAIGCNRTSMSCHNEKLKCLEQRKQDALAQQMSRECAYNLYLLNMTTQVRIDSLQEKLAALQLRSQLEQGALSGVKKNLQDQLDRTEKEKQACEIDRLGEQSRMQNYQTLTSQVISKLDPVRQDLRSSIEQVMAKFTSCYQLSGARQDFNQLTETVRNQFDVLARQVEQKVSSVAEENGRLQSQKAACAQSVQEKERQAGDQKQQCEREKQLLRDAHDAETKKMYAERQHLVGEKETLQLQLQQSKSACLNLRGASSFPSSSFIRPGSPVSSGGTNTMGIPWNAGKVVNTAGSVSSPHIFPGRSGAVGQPNPASLGIPSNADRLRTPLENKRTPLENGKLMNQPPAITAGQPPSG